jgi:hypothetical protein
MLVMVSRQDQGNALRFQLEGISAFSACPRQPGREGREAAQLRSTSPQRSRAARQKSAGAWTQSDPRMTGLAPEPPACRCEPPPGPGAPWRVPTAAPCRERLALRRCASAGPTRLRANDSARREPTQESSCHWMCARTVDPPESATTTDLHSRKAHALSQPPRQPTAPRQPPGHRATTTTPTPHHGRAPHRVWARIFSDAIAQCHPSQFSQSPPALTWSTRRSHLMHLGFAAR